MNAQAQSFDCFSQGSGRKRPALPERAISAGICEYIAHSPRASFAGFNRPDAKSSGMALC